MGNLFNPLSVFVDVVKAKYSVASRVNGISALVDYSLFFGGNLSVFCCLSVGKSAIVGKENLYFLVCVLIFKTLYGGKICISFSFTIPVDIYAVGRISNTVCTIVDIRIISTTCNC